MEGIIEVLGTLGAYFAVLLVLAVAVETMLDALKLFPGLRKGVSPEQVMKDVKEWLPEESEGAVKATAIANFVEEFNVTKKDIESRAKAIAETASETAGALGVPGLTDPQKKVAVAMSAIRQKYIADEQTRIVILRLISAALGIAIALILGINTFDLLADLFPVSTQAFLTSDIAGVGGVILTGLAASAGSSFWHDQLGKVRALKEAVQKVEEATK